jgi:hypothetical protein
MTVQMQRGTQSQLCETEIGVIREIKHCGKRIRYLTPSNPECIIIQFSVLKTEE